MSISPFIRHWEAAKFDAEHLAEVNSRNLDKRMRRRKRRRRDVARGGAEQEDDDGRSSYNEDTVDASDILDCPQEPIRLNFSAHDR